MKELILLAAALVALWSIAKEPTANINPAEIHTLENFLAR